MYLEMIVVAAMLGFTHHHSQRNIVQKCLRMSVKAQTGSSQKGQMASFQGRQPGWCRLDVSAPTGMAELKLNHSHIHHG